MDSTDDSNLSPSPFNSSPLAFSPFGRSQSSQDDDEEIAVEDYVMGDGGEEGYGDEFGEDGDQMFMMDEEVRNNADVRKISLPIFLLADVSYLPQFPTFIK